MLGFVLAVVVEATTGKNVIQQTQTEQLPIALVVITFIVASLVPIVRGVPRRGNSIFTADAELWNGRLVSVLCLYVHSMLSTFCHAFAQVPVYLVKLVSCLAKECTLFSLTHMEVYACSTFLLCFYALGT